jgi:hypothetical protein
MNSFSVITEFGPGRSAKADLIQVLFDPSGEALIFDETGLALQGTSHVA